MKGHPSIEDSEDAILDGGRPIEGGTALSALKHRTFRIVFIGAFASNIGTWMQNAILGAYAFTLTGSASYVGLLVFAQLGPSLLLSLIGGWIADVVDRRRLLIWVSIEQLIFSLGLALITTSSDPSRVAMFLMVLAVGVGQALYAPAYSAILPALVGRRDLAGAISLNSAQMNGSRVIGPIIGGFVLHEYGPSWVFAGNAVTYLFVVLSLFLVVLPPHTSFDSAGSRGLRQLTVGIRVARYDKVVGRCLVIIFGFSAFALTFVGQLAVVAERNFGIKADSAAFGLLYGTFGVGALLGALSIGTVLASRPKPQLTRVGMLGYAAALALFAIVRAPGLAFLTVAILGFFYFGMITSLSTVLQERLDDSIRGRVMALWIMGFGGTVGLGNLVAGSIIDATSVTTVLLVNACVAVLLAWYADLRTPPDALPLAIAPPDGEFSRSKSRANHS